MFAPITRTFTVSFDSVSVLEKASEKMPYIRNKLKFPSDLGENLGFLKEWKEVCNTDGFDYDYHYMWDHYKDFGYYGIAKTIHADIKHLSNIGLNGLVSCQEQRVFLPTAMGQHIMAKTLWNKNIDFETEAKLVLKNEFGLSFEAVFEYLKNLSELMLPHVIRREEDIKTEENAKSFELATKRIEEFKTVIADNINNAADCLSKTSWENLSFHSELCKMLCECYAALARGKYTPEMLEKIKDFVYKNEWEMRNVFDVYEFLKVITEFVHYVLTGEEKCLAV